jgi:hypothetical protein
MADPALKGKLRGILDVCVIVFVVASLTYWLLFAVFLPVIALGAINYNLARLGYAETGGFFGNRTWSDARQIVHPWAFDAIHLPFLKLGMGFGLPSFVCMIGCLFVAWRIISVEYDRSTAWCCLAALLALPPIVFQGTVTKNDFGVAFGVTCWFYAYWLHRRENLPKYAVFMAVGLGFAAGAKHDRLATQLPVRRRDPCSLVSHAPVTVMVCAHDAIVTYPSWQHRNLCAKRSDIWVLPWTGWAGPRLEK